jgi:2-C-methyl-D-erythritol 4-phosphate cytidylyltransferase
MKHCCIIVAGGNGSRMGAEIPKQFLQIGGIPLLMHTILQFRPVTSISVGAS